jgi:hypothetical protein
MHDAFAVNMTTLNGLHAQTKQTSSNIFGPTMLHDVGYTRTKMEKANNFVKRMKTQTFKLKV